MHAQAPAFNFQNESRRRFCADHKVEGMVNLRKKRPRPDSDALAPMPGTGQPQVRAVRTLHHPNSWKCICVGGCVAVVSGILISARPDNAELRILR